MSSYTEWQDNLPEGWLCQPIKAVANYRVSNVDKLSAHDESQVRLCNYTDVYGNEFITSGLNFMQATASDDEISKFRLEIGDVLITKDSEAWDDIGVPALVVQTAEDLLCGYHLAMIRPDTKKIDGAFLFRCLQSKVIGLQLELAASGVTRFGVPKGAIGSLKLPVPSLAEQQRIVSYLYRQTARINKLIESKERLLELLAEKRQAMITQAITSGLNADVSMKNSGVDWLGLIPEQWDVMRLKFVGQTIIGLTYAPDDVVDEGEGTLVLRSSNIQDGKLALDDCVFVNKEIPQHLRTRKGDILICARNGSAHLVGKCALIDERSEGQTFGAFMSIFRSEAAPFVRYFLNSPLFKSQMGLFSTATINQLTTEILNNMVIPFPPLAERQAIVSFIDKQSTKIESAKKAVEDSVALLKERRSTLITSAVTGKFRL